VVTLGWQCAELLCSDYLYMLPKQHVPSALSVLAAFAQQVLPALPPNCLCWKRQRA
jgi:hypothetical protein